MIPRILGTLCGVVMITHLALAAEPSRTRSKGQPDNPTPQIRILSPATGDSVRGPDLKVRIETKDFKFAYGDATTPGTMTKLPAQYNEVPQKANAGHVHVYLASYPREGVRPAQFFMVKDFLMPNATEFQLQGLAPGKYRLLVELVAHDHTPRIKHHPTDWPPLDSVDFTVEPPATPK